MSNVSDRCSMKPPPANKLSNLLPPVSRYRYEPKDDYSYFKNPDEHPFEADAEDFSLVNAWWLMDASMLAWSKPPIVAHWCRKAGLSVERFEHGKTESYIAIHEKYVFVVFRGSDPPKRFHNFILDWKLNSQTALVPFKAYPGSIHRGFKTALENVSDPRASVGGLGVGLLARVREIADTTGATVWFTGHSLGAAIAIVAAAQYVKDGGKAHFYAFGSPKIGDRTLQESLNVSVPGWRIVNSTDIITHLPPFGYYSRRGWPFKWPLLGRYRSVGKLRFIDEHGNIGLEEVEHPEKFHVFTYVQHKFRKFWRQFTNHAPLHYAIHITNAMVNAETHEFPALSAGAEPRRWGWLKWSIAILLLVLIAGEGLVAGIKWWMGDVPDSPPAALILENGLGADREDFYTLAEGSEMFPLAVAQAIRVPKDEVEKMAMAQEKGKGTFGWLASWVKSDKTRLLDNLENFGFIRVPVNKDGNRLGYIGLTVSRREGTGVEMLGVNCAACHVGQLTFKKKVIRIDGAPNMLDIFGFVTALSESFKLPNVNALILANAVGVSFKDLSIGGWSRYTDQVNRHQVLQQETTTMPLNGRADAFGTARAMFFDDFRQLTSPASYPHLWGLEKTAWYHWNTNTNSVIERNVGEALGLGAVLDPETCKTSIKFDALDRLEKLASKLTAPSWPPELGIINKEAAARGEKIYLRECTTCHDGYEQEWQGTRELNLYNTYPVSEVGTDPNEALNFAPSVPVRKDLCNGNKGVPEQQNFGKAHETLLGGVRFDSSVQTVSQPYFQLNAGRDEPKWRVQVFCNDEKGRLKDMRDCPVYPAKPLVGIWATAPYLHNGSVASIMELLTRPADRLTTFRVGQREYDPQTLGYSQKPEDTKRSQSFDTAISGNSNSGHDYGTGLAEHDKLDLIEFLKSLKEGDQERLNALFKQKPQKK